MRCGRTWSSKQLLKDGRHTYKISSSLVVTLIYDLIRNLRQLVLAGENRICIRSMLNKLVSGGMNSNLDHL
jgi:hypothetical protein